MNTASDLRAICEHAERQFNGGQTALALRALPGDLGVAARPDIADHERLRLLLTRARLLVTYVHLDGDESRTAHHTLNDAQRAADRRCDAAAAAAILHERGRLALAEQLRFERPDYTLARTQLQHALTYREAHGSNGELAATLTQLGVVAQAQRQPDEALAATSRAYAVSKVGPHKAEQSEAALRLGLLLRARGDAEAALKHLYESLRLREEAGLRVHLPFSQLALGETLMLSGRMNDAWTQLSHANAASASLGLRRAMALTALALAEWHIRADQRTDALVELHLAFRLGSQLRHEAVRQRAGMLIERLG